LGNQRDSLYLRWGNQRDSLEVICRRKWTCKRPWEIRRWNLCDWHCCVDPGGPVPKLLEEPLRS
jgi:hypothetical protein